MNKISSIALSAALALGSIVAKADQLPDLRPYAGVDYQLTHSDYQGGGNDFFKQNLNGANVHIGVRPYKFAGLELGYFATEDGTKRGTFTGLAYNTKARAQGATLDILGYYPVTSQVDLIGTAGVLWDKARGSVSGPAIITQSTNKSEIDWRVGGGAQVALTKQVNLRGLVRYQTADFDDTVDHAWVYTAGVNYNF